MILKRIIRVYLIIGKTFGKWITPIITGILISLLRVGVWFGQKIDIFIFPSIKKKLKSPIIIVGNPRSGTTFLHRFLINNGLGVGSQLWQLVYPSIIIQKLIKPFLPILEFISPARHHSTKAHKTSLTSVETDDVSLLFRYFDGFFLYGFFLTFDEEDLFEWVDPKIRDTSKRDFNWFETMWTRNMISNKGERYIGKLFSLSGNLPAFIDRFPDAKILYMIRDPLNVIPSGLSLVTGVLDKKFNFWTLNKKIRDRFIQRLYKALIQLLNRFHDDWSTGKIDKKKVLIIPFDDIMSNFESVMDNIMEFVDFQENDEIKKTIQNTAKNQRRYKSEHKYNLEKFGLTEEQIRKDCANIYRTFLN
ncbi:MAG: sulfotransferase [Candidatus Marinimicrobia bacterium]|nr:sulfotransferase [Candidatus Neomarinimicrobiota bacterium]MBT3502020.1 sulfotransferase [Candidatus Neomarinimicrobiota bacterium]MBT3839144.1 sulfotransferase [Candidatus Neomarinimicrobiota bacterium]MBT3998984.1 sulfotransferase [Candidatus Neomarinimicrobiota bacterium]MBT4283444.1 sulfotransferase [Candidatus Neomarinimicrobiota bacterium]